MTCRDSKTQKVFKYLGRVKTRLSRMAIYYQFIQLGLTIYLTFTVGFSWWLVLLFVPFLLAYKFEVKYGITSEMDIVWRASSEWNEFKKNDAEFKEEVRRYMNEGILDSRTHAGNGVGTH